MSAKDKKVQEETEHKAVDPSKEADWMNKQVIFNPVASSSSVRLLHNLHFIRK